MTIAGNSLNPQCQQNTATVTPRSNNQRLKIRKDIGKRMHQLQFKRNSLSLTLECILLIAFNIISSINFPMNCHAYFSYFNPLNTFQPLQNLQIFTCKQNCANTTKIDVSLNFISEHQQLHGIRITTNDIEDAYDTTCDDLLSIAANTEEYKQSYITRSELFAQYVMKFNNICSDILNALNNSEIRCKNHAII